MERSLSFHFEMEPDDPIPTTVRIEPNPNQLGDNVLLMTIAGCLRTLAVRHGLDVTLDMVNDAAFGRLPGDHTFDMLWEEQE